MKNSEAEETETITAFSAAEPFLWRNVVIVRNTTGRRCWRKCPDVLNVCGLWGRGTRMEASEAHMHKTVYIETSVISDLCARARHTIPVEVTPPSDSWTSPFASLAGECGVEMSVEQAFSLLKAFLSDGRVLE